MDPVSTHVSRPVPRRRSARLALAFALTLCGVAGAADEAPFDERRGNVFFEEPDSRTRRDLGDLVGKFATGAVRQRRRWRRELRAHGYWAVAPLIDSLRAAEPPIRAAAALTLINIPDPRATVPLREAAAKETSHPYVGAFSALALGRRHDAEAVPAFAKALRSSKNMLPVRAAVPLALALIRTPEAGSLLQARISAGEGNARVEGARLLALGFFPEAALRKASPEPAPLLAASLRGKRAEHRRAAAVAYLVATADRDDTRDVLKRLIDRRPGADVLPALLLGLSRYEDREVSAMLADAATRADAAALREYAMELLIARGDASVLPELLGAVRRQSQTELRAAAVLAVGSVDHEDARAAVLGRLTDRAPLVRAAAAVAAARTTSAELRAAAKKRIGLMVRRGESDRAVRANLSEALALLEGAGRSPSWTPVGGSRLFERLDVTYEQRLVRAVNDVAEAALDLRKIHNLMSDVELSGGDGQPAAGPSGDGTSGGDDDGGDPGGGDPGGGDPGGRDGGGDGDGGGGAGGDGDGGISGGPGGGVRSGGLHPQGQTATWPELRDLKVELREFPLFESGDLPRRRRPK